MIRYLADLHYHDIVSLHFCLFLDQFFTIHFEAGKQTKLLNCNFVSILNLCCGFLSTLGPFLPYFRPVSIPFLVLFQSYFGPFYILFWHHFNSIFGSFFNQIFAFFWNFINPILTPFSIFSIFVQIFTPILTIAKTSLNIIAIKPQRKKINLRSVNSLKDWRIQWSRKCGIGSNEMFKNWYFSRQKMSRKKKWNNKVAWPKKKLWLERTSLLIVLSRVLLLKGPKMVLKNGP